MRYAFKYAFFKRDEFYLLARFKEILELQVDQKGVLFLRAVVWCCINRILFRFRKIAKDFDGA